MKKLIIGLAALAVILSCSYYGRYTDVASEGAKKTVRIYFEFKAGDKKLSAGYGSGVFVSKYGHILTCAHVVPFYSEAQFKELKDMTGIKAKLVVTIQNGITFENPRIVRVDRQKDLAILKIQYHTPRYAKIARYVRLGQEVVAVGHPLGQDWSVTTGVISALDRKVFSYLAYQTDAAINPGNSGGPLFDLRGHLVGINSAVLSPIRPPVNTGLGYAVSLKEIHELMSLFGGL